MRAVYRYAFIRVVGRADGLGLDSDVLINDLHTLKLHTGVPSGSPNGARLKNNNRILQTSEFASPLQRLCVLAFKSFD